MTETVNPPHELEPVIGLEVHAQLMTRSKMFCGCSARYSGAAPNTHVCAVCGGMPGALPVINARAIEYAISVALALNCSVADFSKFDRKNYSYPDLPKGYQISQYDLPLAREGWTEYEVDGRVERCGITRVHVEEDTGKTVHAAVQGKEVSLVDYNRSGVPLLEIVGEPDVRSPMGARQYFAALRHILMYLGVNDGNLQEGSMRADVNVSLRRPGDPLPASKVEIKNLNSFRAVQRAVEYEIERQAGVVRSGGRVQQETRGWSEAREQTLAQRTKEYAADYRYFPEPDLPPLVTTRADVERIQRELPELPRSRYIRFVDDLGVPADLAGVLTDQRPLAEFFEKTVELTSGVPAAHTAKWIAGELLGLLNESRSGIDGSSATPAAMAYIVQHVESGALSTTAGKEVLKEMFASGAAPDDIVRSRDLAQVSDESRIGAWVDSVIADNPTVVDTYLGGKANAAQALTGQIMKLSRGKANPRVVSRILRERLAGLARP